MRSDYTPYNNEPPPERHPNFAEWLAENHARSEAEAKEFNAAIRVMPWEPGYDEASKTVTRIMIPQIVGSLPMVGSTRLVREAAKDTPKIMEALQAKLGAGPGTDISLLTSLAKGGNPEVSVPTALDRVSKQMVENTQLPYGRDTLADLMSSDRELVNGKALGAPIMPPQKMNRPFLFTTPDMRRKALDMRIKVAGNLGASPYAIQEAKNAALKMREYDMPDSIVKTWHRGDTRLPQNVREEIETNWKPQPEFDSGLSYQDTTRQNGTVIRTVTGPDGTRMGSVSFDPVYGADKNNLFTPGLASLNSSTWGSGLGTKVYSDFEKDFGVKIVPNNAQSIRAQNLWLRKGYGRDFGVPLSEGSPYSFWDNAHKAYRLSKKLGDLPARKKLPEYQPPKEFLNEQTGQIFDNAADLEASYHPIEPSPGEADADRINSMADELARLRRLGRSFPAPTPWQRMSLMTPKLQNAIDQIRAAGQAKIDSANDPDLLQGLLNNTWWKSSK